MNHLKRVIIVLATAGLCSLLLSTEEAPLKYPVTKKINQVDDYFGVKVNDPYRWLEDANSKDTAEWVTAQKNLTETYLAGIPFRENLKSRFTEVFNYDSYSHLSRQGKYYVFWKYSSQNEQPVIYIQEGLDGDAKILLDPNTFPVNSSNILTEVAFSNDQKFCGYAISQGGSDWREYFVMETETGKKLNDHIQWAKTSKMSWYKDGFFYNRYDELKEADKLKAKLEFQKIFYHKVGTPQSEDKLIYRDNSRPKLTYAAKVTDNEKYLVITTWEGGATYNFLYYKNLETDSPVIPLIDKPLCQLTFVAEVDDRFLVMIDREAPNSKLILIDPLNPREENWKAIIPESKYKMLDVSYIGGRLIVSYLKDASSVVSLFEPDGQKLYDIALPGIGTVQGFKGKKEDNEVFYTFSSLTNPTTIYRYLIKENRVELFRKANVKFDPDKFETTRVFYESKDKTRVPLFIVHKKGLELNGQNPTILFGYGGFGTPMQLSFRSHIIPLLENNGIYAIPCIRGGGEYGEEWHSAGMLEKKQNTFDDFIAAAEYLIAKGYTSPHKLAIFGMSHGGLLAAAVMIQRPDLFRVAFPTAAVLDMLRYQKFTVGWAWAGEFGTSENPEQFKYLIAYSPLHNIKEGVEYPAAMVATADHDDRVLPAHSFKYVATMQEKYKGKNPILLRVETKVGHGTGITLTKAIESYSDMYSFMFYNMGISPVFK